MKILMVCLGNICRSPMAEGILRSKLPDSFIIDSAGIADYHEKDKADKRAIEICKKHNINISNHRGRQIQNSDFEEFDTIYVMDHANYNDIMFKVKREADKKKIKLILSENPNTDKKSIPDPYYGDLEGFQTIYEQLDEVCAIIAQNLLKTQYL